MRLFIALNFNDETKSAITAVQNKLKALSKGGNFTRIENLHLTLVFIGETERKRISNLISVIDKISVTGFDITLSGFGSFGSLYWLGIKKCAQLDAIYNQLCFGLAEKGFKVEKREFKPHITLARELTPLPEFVKADFAKNVPEIKQRIERISLMKSERIDGKLAYTEIHGKDLTV